MNKCVCKVDGMFQYHSYINVYAFGVKISKVFYLLSLLLFQKSKTAIYLAYKQEPNRMMLAINETVRNLRHR